MSQIWKPDIPPSLHPCEWIKDEKFWFFDDDEPYLVLYTPAYHLTSGDEPSPYVKAAKPTFREPKKWVNIYHQTGGYACHNVLMHARFLKPRKSVLPLLKELVNEYNDSLIVEPPNFETAAKYSSILVKYGLNANEDYVKLAEGFYPIDIECLRKVTAEKFPKNLQDLLKPVPKKKRTRWDFFLRHKWFGLAVLGPNCD